MVNRFTSVNFFYRFTIAIQFILWYTLAYKVKIEDMVIL